MKKIFYLVGLIAATIFSCEPLNETYKELDSLVPDPTAAQVFEITLTDDDYEWLDDEYGIAGYGNFESVDEAKQYIPFILNKLYPQLGDGSAITVKYNLYRGTAEAVFQYTGADRYMVTEADYNSLGGEAADYGLFTANQAPRNNIPSILADTLTDDHQEGDIILVTYKFIDEVVDPSVSLTMDTEHYQLLVDFIKSTKGADWVDSYGTLEFYYGSGAYFRNFEGRASKFKDWRTNNNLTDDLFDGSTTAQEDSLRVQQRIQEGVVKFLELQYPNAQSQINGADVFYNISYKVYYGSAVGTITYYVQYQSDDAGSFDLVQGPSRDQFASSSLSETRGSYYILTGGRWEPVEKNVYYLSSADYDAMGAPGQYDNFSSSVPADNYIPQLLKMKYPYAQEEDEMIVTYKYYSSSSGVRTRGQVYTYLNNEWVPFQPEVEQMLQFSNEEGVWVPDNTIRYTLTPADYTAIANNTELGNDAARGNLAGYGNFNIGSGYWSTADIIEAIDYILHENFPASDVGQKYLVTYNTYPAGDLQVHLILHESGEYVPVE